MNKKGFAISGIVYTILILFLALVMGILGLLGNRKLLLDKLKNDVTNTLNNNEIVRNIYIDNSGAAYPELYYNMVPVVYTDGNWVYADIYSKWYDYNLKQWANAVVLNTGVTKNVGDIISESEIALWYVWIPRYKYVIQSSTTANLFNITFENKNDDKSLGSTTGAYLTHPAFTFGDTELNGIWVGKFESSNKENSSSNNSNLTLTIKPNVSSWRSIKLNNAFTATKNAEEIYSLVNVDSHIIKNTEWGAVAYLTTSIYGQGLNEIRINNSSKYTTGCAATSESSTSYAGCENAYNTEIGVLASTTGNIYGIYDMSGSAWELVMGVMQDNTNNSIPMSGSSSSNNSGYYGMLTNGSYYQGESFPQAKYYDIYSYSTDSTDFSRGILGDATRETSGWNSDASAFVSSAKPWFNRGGSGGAYYSGTSAGIFSFDITNPGVFNFLTFRAVLTQK